MNVCDWFFDNKLSIHFGEDPLFSNKDTYLPELKITYNNNRLTQYRMVEYLGCCLDANLSGESIAKKFVLKINAKLQSLYRQNENKCIRFCFKLNSRQHIGAKEKFIRQKKLFWAHTLDTFYPNGLNL